MKDDKLKESPKAEKTKIISRIKAKFASLKERLPRKKKQEEETTPGEARWVQLRILPIWLRIILIILLLAGVAALGVRIGYGYIGDGNPADALKKETWMHIVDIIKGKE